MSFVPGLQPIGIAANAINAYLYFEEGNTFQGICSALSALPGLGTTIGNIGKAGSKLSTATGIISKFLHTTSNVGFIATGSYTIGSMLKYNYDHYIEGNETYTWKNALNDLVNGTFAVLSIYGGAKGLGLDKIQIGGKTPKYLENPATKNGTLNIGAGSKPIEGAYNIDINPRAKGVHYGDATNLTNIPTGSQSRIIIENPYGYDPLNPEVLRVLQDGGVIEIIGANSNKFVNKIPKIAPQLGFNITTTSVPNVGQYTYSNGNVIPAIGKNTEFVKYILYYAEG